MISKKTNKGFALPVSLMLLVVMTLMGVALVSVILFGLSKHQTNILWEIDKHVLIYWALLEKI